MIPGVVLLAIAPFAKFATLLAYHSIPQVGVVVAAALVAAIQWEDLPA